MSKVNKIAMSREDAVNMYDFIDQTKQEHLTIADVEKLKEGDELDVVLWDRNFEEVGGIWDCFETDKAYPATEFFEGCRTKLVYRGDYTWDIHFEDEVVKHPFHLNTEHLDTNWTWVILNKDGMIHITQEIIPKDEGIPAEWSPKHIHYNEFPKNTRVGWRGPVMLWEKLLNAPQIYDKKGYYGAN